MAVGNYVVCLRLFKKAVGICLAVGIQVCIRFQADGATYTPTATLFRPSAYNFFFQINNLWDCMPTPFCEEVFWKLCQNSSLSFILSTNTHKRTPCRRISFFEYFFTFFYFFEKRSKWPPCLFIERGRIIQNYRRFCDITTTCVT